MASDSVIAWRLDGDPAVRWQVMRDLLRRQDRTWRRERLRVARTGWGLRLLDLQLPDGNWGRGLYRPKWTCTTTRYSSCDSSACRRGTPPP